MKRRALIAAALVTLVAASLAASAGAGTQAGARSEAAAVSCKGTINIGNLTVLTGPAAFLGQSQQSWAELAAKRVGATARAQGQGHRVRHDARPGGRADGGAAARRQQEHPRHDRPGDVRWRRAPRARRSPRRRSSHVTPSATDVDLTKGRSPTATRFFYRVVGDDSVQGTGQAKYTVDKLNADKVTVFDAQEPYSVGLAEHDRAVARAAATSRCSGCRSRTTRPTSRAS